MSTLFSATNWCMKHTDFLNVETSLVGCILNGLAHMRGDISGRLEFGVALVRGLGGNLNETGREAFAKEIFKWCGESHPGRYVIDFFYSSKRFYSTNLITVYNPLLTLM